MSIDIAASPQQTWAIISDITRTGEWSPECVKVDLEGGQVVPGARFVGHNRDGSREWQMHGVVDSVEAPQLFSFHTERGGEVRTRWTYRLAPGASGGTVLTESWHRVVTPPALARLIERIVLRGRDRHNRANVLASLERIKALAEAA